jgi:hypothetical protein
MMSNQLKQGVNILFVSNYEFLKNIHTGFDDIGRTMKGAHDGHLAKQKVRKHLILCSKKPPLL